MMKSHVKSEYLSSETLTDLVTRSQSGDMSSLGELLENFYPIGVKTAYKTVRTLDHASVEDILQLSHIKIMSHIGQLSDPLCFPGWYTITVSRLTINFYRDEVMHNRRFVTSNEYDVCDYLKFSPDPEPIELLIRSEMKNVVLQYLGKLRENDSKILHQKYIKSMTMEEICRKENIPMSTVKRRLFNARERAKILISEASRQEV